jgi:hypothetical protein
LKRALALGALALATACGDAHPEGSVVASDARYRVTAHADPVTVAAAGRLRVRVETQNGWHVTAEAPARLDWSGPPALRFEPAALRQDDLVPLGEDAFEFVTAVGSERAGTATARGQLKFGICEGPKAKCVIVRRELELPIEVAASP